MNLLQTLNKQYECELSSRLKVKQNLEDNLAIEIKDLNETLGHEKGKKEAKILMIKVAGYHLGGRIHKKCYELSFNKSKGDYYDELSNECYAALIEYINKKEIKNGYICNKSGNEVKEKLLGHFWARIKGALCDYNLKSHDIGMPPELKRIKAKIRKTKQEAGREISNNEIIESLALKSNINKKDIEEVMAIGEIRYLDEKLNEEGLTLGETISSENALNYRGKADESMKAVIDDIMFKTSEFNDVKKDIFTLFATRAGYYEKDKNSIKTHAEIAKKYNKSSSAVSQQQRTLKEQLIESALMAGCKHSNDYIENVLKGNKNISKSAEKIVDKFKNENKDNDYLKEILK